MHPKLFHSAFVFGVSSILFWACSDPAASSPPLPSGPASVGLLEVASGLSTPLYITAPPGDTARLFIVEKTGAIRIVKAGSLLPVPFLDIGTLVSSGSEQGLLGLAFDPDYADQRALRGSLHRRRWEYTGFHVRSIIQRSRRGRSSFRAASDLRGAAVSQSQRRAIAVRARWQPLSRFGRWRLGRRSAGPRPGPDGPAWFHSATRHQNGTLCGAP